MKKLLIFTGIILFAAVISTACQQTPTADSSSVAAEETSPTEAALTKDATTSDDAAAQEGSAIQEVAPLAAPAGDLDLTGQKFVLISFDGEAVESFMIPTLQFGDDPFVSGRICNNFRASGEITGSRLLTKGVASTRMACPDEKLSQLESTFFNMLEKGVNLSLDDSTLTLSQSGHTLIFKVASEEGSQTQN